jgi:anti-sigma regulatory factor (Ser/Thr protein kinase)
MIEARRGDRVWIFPPRGTPAVSVPDAGDIVESTTRSLQANRRAPSEARRHVVEACTGWPESAVKVARLLTTEVVTNAVIHGAGDVGLAVTVEERMLRVEVSDESPELPVLVPLVNPAQRGGRGLQILTAMATAWGVEPRDDPPGKTVWFELRKAVSTPCAR